MNTQKIKVVFLDTRTKIRNEAMPLKAWIVVVIFVDCALFSFGIHPIAALIPILVAGIAMFLRRKILA